jgi:hypothetical protein
LKRLMERELSAPAQVFAVRHPNGILHRFEVYEAHTRYMLMQESMAFKDEWQAIHTRVIEKPFTIADVREYLGLESPPVEAPAVEAPAAPLEEYCTPQNLLRNASLRLIDLYEDTPSKDYINRLAILKELREVAQALYSTAPLPANFSLSGSGSFFVPTVQPLSLHG